MIHQCPLSPGRAVLCHTACGRGSWDTNDRGYATRCTFSEVHFIRQHSSDALSYCQSCNGGLDQSVSLMPPPGMRILGGFLEGAGGCGSAGKIMDSTWCKRPCLSLVLDSCIVHACTAYRTCACACCMHIRSSIPYSRAMLTSLFVTSLCYVALSRAEGQLLFFSITRQGCCSVGCCLFARGTPTLSRPSPLLLLMLLLLYSYFALSRSVCVISRSNTSTQMM